VHSLDARANLSSCGALNAGREKDQVYSTYSSGTECVQLLNERWIAGKYVLTTKRECAEPWRSLHGCHGAVAGEGRYAEIRGASLRDPEVLSEFV
jgi:hypothetical protein